MDDDVVAKYDAAAHTYSQRYADPAAVAAFYLDLIRGWGPRPPDGARVLEISCADGFMTEALVRAGFAVTAMDIAPKMVAATRERLTTVGLAAQLVVADIRTFQPHQTWDVIVAPMWTFFAYVEDAAPILVRLAGALTPGGKLLVDRNPRTHPVDAGVAAMRSAGLVEVAWRPVSVPLTRRLGAASRGGLSALLAVSALRNLVLRRRLNVVLMGSRPG